MEVDSVNSTDAFAEEQGWSAEEEDMSHEEWKAYQEEEKANRRLRKIQVQDMLAMRKPNELLARIPKPRDPLPRDALPAWKDIPLDAKLPSVPAPEGSFRLSRNPVGKKLFLALPEQEFDNVDPYIKETPVAYIPLHDPNLKDFFKQNRKLIERLQCLGLVTSAGEVTCSLEDLNKYRLYLSRIHKGQVKKQREKQEEAYTFEKTQTKKIKVWLGKENKALKDEELRKRRNDIRAEAEFKKMMGRAREKSHRSNSLKEERALENAMRRRLSELKSLHRNARLDNLRKAEIKRIRKLILKWLCKETFSKQFRAALQTQKKLLNQADLQDFIIMKRDYQERKIKYNKAVSRRNKLEQSCMVAKRQRDYEENEEMRKRHYAIRSLKEADQAQRIMYLMKKYGGRWLAMLRKKKDQTNETSVWHIRHQLRALVAYLKENSGAKTLTAVFQDLMKMKSRKKEGPKMKPETREAVDYAISKFDERISDEIKKMTSSCQYEHLKKSGRMQPSPYEEILNEQEFIPPAVPVRQKPHIDFQLPIWPCSGPCAQFGKRKEWKERCSEMAEDLAKIHDELSQILTEKLTKDLKNALEDDEDGSGAGRKQRPDSDNEYYDNEYEMAKELVDEDVQHKINQAKKDNQRELEEALKKGKKGSGKDTSSSSGLAESLVKDALSKSLNATPATSKQKVEGKKRDGGKGPSQADKDKKSAQGKPSDKDKGKGKGGSKEQDKDTSSSSGLAESIVKEALSKSLNATPATSKRGLGEQKKPDDAKGPGPAPGDKDKKAPDVSGKDKKTPDAADKDKKTPDVSDKNKDTTKGVEKDAEKQKGKPEEKDKDTDGGSSGELAESLVKDALSKSLHVSPATSNLRVGQQKPEAGKGQTQADKDKKSAEDKASDKDKGKEKGGPKEKDKDSSSSAQAPKSVPKQPPSKSLNATPVTSKRVLGEQKPDDAKAPVQAPAGKDKKTPDVSDKDKKTPDVSDKDKKTPDVSDKDKKTPDVSDKDKKTPDVSDKDKKTPDVADKDKKTPDVADKVEKTPDVTDKDEKTPDVADKDEKTPDVSDKDKKTSDVAEKDKKTPDVSDKDKKTPDVADNDKKTPDLSDKDKKTPDVADKDEKTPDVSDKDEKTPVVADKDEKTPAVSDTDKKTPDVVDKVEKTPEVSDKDKKTPDVADKVEKTPEVSDKDKKTPDISDKDKKTPDILDKDKKTPDVADKDKKTPDVSDKDKKTPVVADKDKKTPDVSDKDKKTLDVSDKDKKTPDVAEKDEKTPDVAEEYEKTPEISDKDEKTPGVADKDEKTPDVLDKDKKTPDVSDKVEKSPDVAEKDEKTQDVADKDKKTPDVSEKVEKTPDVTDKDEKTPDVLDKDKKTPDVADKDKKSPDVSDKVEKTPAVVDKDEKTPDVSDKDEKTPVVADKDEKTPAVSDKDKKTPDVADKDRKTPDVADKDEKTPDVADKDKMTPDVSDKVEKAPDVAGKDKKTPDVVDEYQKAPDVADKDEKAPDVADKDEITPDAVDKDKMTPDVSDKDKKTPDVADKDKKAPDVADKDEIAPDVADKDKMAPDVADKDQKAPDVADTDKMTPDVSDKDKKTPDVADKDKKTPDVVDEYEKTPDVSDKDEKTLDVSDKEEKTLDVSDKDAEKQKDKPEENDKDRDGSSGGLAESLVKDAVSKSGLSESESSDDGISRLASKIIKQIPKGQDEDSSGSARESKSVPKQPASKSLNDIPVSSKRALVEEKPDDAKRPRISEEDKDKMTPDEKDLIASSRAAISESESSDDGISRLASKIIKQIPKEQVEDGSRSARESKSVPKQPDSKSLTASPVTSKLALVEQKPDDVKRPLPPQEDEYQKTSEEKDRTASSRARKSDSESSDDGISRVASKIIKQVIKDQNSVLQRELDLIGSGDESSLKGIVTEDNLSRVASIFVDKVLCKETRNLLELQAKICTEKGENGPEMTDKLRDYAKELFGNEVGDRSAEATVLEDVRTKLEREVVSHPASVSEGTPADAPTDAPPDVRASIREQLQNVKSQLDIVKSELEQAGVRTKSKESKDK